MALQDKVRRIDDLKKQLDGLLPMPVEQQQKLDEKLRLEFHYNTNHIEGNTLTYGETKLAILFDQVSEGHSLREFEEMKASDVAYKMVQELARDNERPLTESFIKSLNERLLVREYYKEALTPDGQETRRLISIGDYKKHPNSVRLENGEMFHYATPAETPAMMTDMVNWYREEEEKKEHHTVLLAALLHYRFVRIHPFDDGNGRVSRLLMNYVLFKNGYPLVVIKSEDKPNYLRALNRADAGDEGAFIEYIADQLIWSLELSVKAAKGEDIEEQQDWKKKLAVLDKGRGQNKEMKPISFEVVQTLIDNQIIPLFDFVLEYIDDIGNRFLNMEHYLFDGSGMYHFGDTNLESGHLRHSEFFNLRKIGLKIYLKDYKRNEGNSFNIAGGLLFKLNTFNYELFNTTQTEKLIFKKSYDDKISESDFIVVGDSLASSLVETIQQEMAKTQSS